MRGVDAAFTALEKDLTTKTAIDRIAGARHRGHEQKRISSTSSALARRRASLPTTFEAFGPRAPCEACDRDEGDSDHRIVVPLRINEEILAECQHLASSLRDVELHPRRGLVKW